MKTHFKIVALVLLCLWGWWATHPHHPTGPHPAPTLAHATNASDSPTTSDHAPQKTAPPRFSLTGPKAPEHAPVSPMRLFESVAHWPNTHAEAKAAIQQFAQAIGLSDAILMNPFAEDSEILENAKSLGIPEAFVVGNLPYVFTIEDSLTAHLNRALLNPELDTLRNVLVSMDVPVSMETDLLVDAFRLGAFHASFGDFMLLLANTTVPDGRVPRDGELDEIRRCLTVREQALETVREYFVERFQIRHGLPPQMASDVVQAVSELQVRTASPPCMGVPRIRSP